jgi:hypothetical protein
MSSIRRRPRFVLVVAVVFLVSFMHPPTALALPETSDITVYYSGCGSLTYLGEEGVDCGGRHTYTYSHNNPHKWIWHYKEVCWENDNCTEYCWPTEIFMEKCQNGSYKYVSATDFWNANCSC